MRDIEKIMNFKVVLVVLAVLCLLGVWFYWGLGPTPPPRDIMSGDLPELNKSDLREIATLRNVGVAQLENHEWLPGIKTFEQLKLIDPNSKLALQNLAIGYLEDFLSLESSTAANRLQAARLAADQAIEDLRLMTPNDPLSYRLEARVQEKEFHIERAVQLLKQAAEFVPEDPTIWFEISRMSQASRDPATLAAGFDAIHRLHELDPENVFGFLEWMTVAIKADEPPLQQVIEELEVLITPFAAGIEKRKRYNVLTLLERVKANLQEDKLAAAKSGLAQIKNVVIGDDLSRSDRDLLDVNSLAFVEFKFPETIETELAALNEQASVDAITVTFKKSPQQPTINSEPKFVQFADLNLDGTLELVALTNSSVEVLKRDSTSNAWKQLVSLEVPAGVDRFLLVDLDDDLQQVDVAETSDAASAQQGPRHLADLDLICFGTSGIQLYENTLDAVGGKVGFRLIADSAGMDKLSFVSCVVPADLNNDGDLDLAVLAAGRLQYWNHLGGFQFEQKILDSQLDEFVVVDTLAVDWDHDIDLDLLVLLQNGSVGLLESYRHGTFRWRDFEQKYSGVGASSLELLDVDRNGSWDVVVSGQSGVELFQTRTMDRSSVRFTTSRMISDHAVDQLYEFDYDNDGYRDLLLSTTSQGFRCLHGGPFGKFAPTNVIPHLDTTESRGCFLADYDADGDDDVVFINSSSVEILVNEGGNANSWINVALQAARVEEEGSSQRINHYGYGSLIELRAGTEFQQAVVRSPITKFGLGRRRQADAVRVIWTNGIPQNIVQPAADQTVWEVQKLSGSCPYLYAWDGETFQFVTDLLWAAPIGLQNAQGELVPTRPWEYLKVPGEMLQADGAKYRLQITEELWEIAYLDKVELIAVDHPADIEIYSNEKVGPPSLADFKIHQVRTPQRPISVKNQVGQDLLKEVLNRDEIYARPFTQRITQGYTNDSYLEIDLGIVEKPKQLTLFLTGWVYPTDTGLNVALHENPRLPGPAPPSIQVPNEQADFVEVIPYCGFPGGKTKTIAIDLSGQFLSSDTRIRLRTSMELYWDQIFFSTETPAQPLQMQTLICKSADFHHRGVSRIQYGQHHGPERFLYDELVSPTAWPTITGKLTRYGDVRELVIASDDRLVVMGTGDELTLEFAVPDQPVPVGWKRDFIFHSVGWDKDANLHTITGQTVEPLPFIGMKSYPYDLEETAPHPVEYLRNYQTREMDPFAFRSVLRRSTLAELGRTEPVARPLNENPR